ncbi:MAG: hypothetical protein QXO71_11490 [Candidatus Jordarchaeaceae archaeon]
MSVKYYMCKNCGAPLSVTKKEELLKCVYCGSVNEISNIEDEMRKFMNDIARWLSSVGAVGGEGTDVAMRARYFADRIFPSLAVEFTNVVGDFVEPLDFPVLYASFYDTLPHLRLDFEWKTNMGKPLQELAYKLSLPNVTSFATTPDSMEKLKYLELRSWMIPLLLNILSLVKSDSVENYLMATKSCDRVVEKIEETISFVEGDKKTYYEILAERFRLNSKYLNELANRIAEKENITEDFLQKSYDAIDNLRKRLKELKEAPRVDKILVEEGLKRDNESYRMFSSILSLYTLSKTPFNEFMRSLRRIVENTVLRPNERIIERVHEGLDISWFTGTLELDKVSWFVENLKVVISKRNVKVYGLDEAETWAEKNIRDAFELYLYPFYLVRVVTILKRGMLLWKKGEENAFYGLCDAAYNLSDQLFLEADYPSVLTPGFSKAVNTRLGKQIEELTQLRKTSVKKNIVILPPTVTASDAQNLYLQAFRFREERELLIKETGEKLRLPSSYGGKGFDPGKVKAILPKTEELIYLPYILSERKSRLFGESLFLEQLPHRQKLVEEMQLFLQAF